MSKIKQAIKHTGRGRKEEIVAQLVEKIDSSNGLVFADYQGLTHKQLEDLKKELKKLDATIVIAKNSLLKLSLGKSKNFADFKDNEGLDLPTATLFIRGDMVEPLKKIQKAIKEFGLPKIKFGILEGNLADEANVLKIASLPNRETLLAQLVGTLNSPIQGLVITLNANITKFVMTLNAVAQSKPALAAVQAPIVESTSEQTLNEPTSAVEEAVPANEPAVQPDAPVETDESADAGTQT
jgi:large subunit ribosomal protein L10